MRIITISREFGSGGRELGKRMADALACRYYDSEIIAAVARSSGLDIRYVEQLLDGDSVRAFPITFRRTLGSTGYVQSSKVELLLRQKAVLEGIAALGQDCVIVGRNADVILREFRPFNVFVCADLAAKLERCLANAPQGENLTERELMHRMRQIDRMRAQTRAILTGSEWGRRDAYHITVNTSGWRIKELTPAVVAFAEHWFGRK